MALGTGTLVDTNIFLEILLNQDRKQECKSYLRDNSESLFISDFSLHSIGVILFKSGKQNIFSDFCEDLLNNVILSTLPQNQYETLPETSERYGLILMILISYFLPKAEILKSLQWIKISEV